MGDGKRTMAPCGHIGEVIIGTYVQCKRCDARSVPIYVAPEKTEPLFRTTRCPACRSRDVAQFEDDVDAALWFITHNNPMSGNIDPPDEGDWYCRVCSKVWK